MLNQTILVGRLTSDPELYETENGKKGDLIGIKGRIQTSNYETDEGMKKNTEVIAEKVTFLSSAKKK